MTPIHFSTEYIVEGHRFNIYEEIGCYPATYNVTLAYPLSIVWPLVIGLASVIYCSKWLFATQVQHLTRVGSSHPSGFYEAPGAVQWIRDLNDLFNDQPLLPSHGSCYSRDFVHDTHCCVWHLSQCHFVTYSAVERPCRCPLQLLAYWTLSVCGLAIEPLQRYRHGAHSLEFSFLCVGILWLLWVCGRGSQKLSEVVPCCRQPVQSSRLYR